MAPDIPGFWDMLSGAYGFETAWLLSDNASGKIIGSNPPYTVNDFLAVYPKFAGTPTSTTGTLTTDSDIIAITDPGIGWNQGAYNQGGFGGDAISQGVGVGHLITGPGIPNGTLITAITPADPSVTISLPATADATAETLLVFTASFIPMPVLILYVALASASLMQQRWLSMWGVAMSMYIAHFATLWMQSDGDSYSTPGAAAAAGLAKGIQVSKSVGDVGVGYAITPGLDQFGAWTLTTYGQQLATIARFVGTGPIYVR